MSGISAENRKALQRLHARFQAPFTTREGAEALDVALPRARRLLRYLADRGWLTRVARGMYATVPLAAREPANWPVDSWVVATRRFEPCYLAGWSALAHHGLTEQIFRAVVVVTSLTVRHRELNSQNIPFVLRHRDRSKFFGLDLVWRDGNRVQVSDRERTLVDVLDEPALAGGAAQVAEALVAYFEDEQRSEDRLIEYGDRLGNGTVFKRLGYLLESLQVGDERLVRACKLRRSSGFTLLDPSVPSNGERNARWGLRTNVPLSHLSST
jgi:predicted transcriptional regulator of viral defense system